MTNKRVAIVYDRVNKWGGAERLLLALHEIYPEAPLYTSVYDPKGAPWASAFSKIIPSFLQKFPYALNNHEWYAPLMPLAFESFDFDNYDLVISLTSEAAKGIITKPKTLHICYCLTPTRYLWQSYNAYFQNGLTRILSLPIITKLREWDQIASQRPDYYLAISENVAQRIKKYYQRDSEVIYPPVNIVSSIQYLVSSKNNKKQNTKYQLQDTNYYLVVSRLVSYKRIDLAISAFNRLGWNLKIIGTGVEMSKLRKMAYKNIDFLGGDLTDQEVFGYYQNCRALIICGIEDFGLTSIEAQSFGKPVIAYGEGGVLESVIDGKTGEFFYPQTQGALIQAIRRCQDIIERGEYKQDDFKKNAAGFSKEIFKEKFKEVVDKYYKDYKPYK